LSTLARKSTNKNKEFDIKFIDKDNGLIEIRYSRALEKSDVLKMIKKWLADDDVVMGWDFTVNSLLLDQQALTKSQSRMGLYFKDPEVFTMLKLRHD